MQRKADRRGVPAGALDPESAVSLASDWLCMAQDMATTHDGGVARSFSLNDGWAASYPETTGYIVPTFIELAQRWSADHLLERARAMLDWLVGIQMEEGSFQGGLITYEPVPVTFNTGQILLGLAAGTSTFGVEYREPMIRAADWLRDAQDDDGCWRRYPTPFASPGEKAYETHVSWALLEADRVVPGRGFGEAGLKQIRWSLSKIQKNGWIRDCSLADPALPLTHTIGYALRGIIEGYRFSGDGELLDASRRIGSNLRCVVNDDGFLAGRLRSDWSAATDWACLTGSAQLSSCLLDLYSWTGEDEYLRAALALVGFVRRTMLRTGLEGAVGGVAGSFPIDGRYAEYCYLNWAAKFFIDAQLAAIDLH